jgi:hypothetical protein
VLSERARRDWQAFFEASGQVGMGAEQLNRFLIGVYRRGDKAGPEELKAMLEATPLPAEAQEWILSFIAPALELLASYDLTLRHEEEWFDEEELAGPGYLVI